MEDPSIRLALHVVLKVNLIYFNNFNCCQEHRYYWGYFRTYNFLYNYHLLSSHPTSHLLVLWWRNTKLSWPLIIFWANLRNWWHLSAVQWWKGRRREWHRRVRWSALRRWYPICCRCLQGTDTAWRWRVYCTAGHGGKGWRRNIGETSRGSKVRISLSWWQIRLVLKLSR